MILQKLKIVLLIILFASGLAFSINHTINALPLLQAEILAWMKSLIFDQEMSLGLLVLRILNIGLFFSLIFMFYVLFSTSLSILFLNKVNMLERAVQWQIYRYYNVFLPTGIYLLFAMVVIGLLVVFFNPIMKISGVDVGIITFISSFIGLNLIFFFILAGFLSFRRFLKYSFGTEMAISHPELRNSNILEKLNNRGINFSLFLIYFAFVVLVAIQYANLNKPAILVFLSLNLLSYAGIKYLKTSAYKKSCV